MAIQLDSYDHLRGDFGSQIVMDSRKLRSPADWWMRFGSRTPELTKFAIRIHTKKRNRLEYYRLNALVYVRYNTRPTFGHPSADAVIDRYLIGKSSSSSTNDQLNMQQNNQYYSQLCREPETEKKKKEESIEESKLVNNDGNDNNGGFWWNEPIDDMGIEELEEFMTALGELKKKVTMRADELNMINGSSSSNSTMQIARFGAPTNHFNFNLNYCT
ncbi:agamous-like MADS-box protein AGL62, partial [Lycium barbarum]|uniref:agamous-like MADS-box protein AGL62 n=1 Tax=Lycium barbarum TaxID=112863 RepID=UPI00293E2FA5